MIEWLNNHPTLESVLIVAMTVAAAVAIVCFIGRSTVIDERTDVPRRRWH